MTGTWGRYMETRNELLAGKPQGLISLRKTGTDGMIILKWVLNNRIFRV
jgi:hypothetical protein